MPSTKAKVALKTRSFRMETHPLISRLNHPPVPVPMPLVGSVTFCRVLDQLPERLLVGTGAYRQMRPDPDIIKALRACRVDVEALPAADAVRRYTQLDPQNTAAVLH